MTPKEKARAPRRGEPVDVVRVRVLGEEASLSFDSNRSLDCESEREDVDAVILQYAHDHALDSGEGLPQLYAVAGKIAAALKGSVLESQAIMADIRARWIEIIQANMSSPAGVQEDKYSPRNEGTATVVARYGRKKVTGGRADARFLLTGNPAYLLLPGNRKKDWRVGWDKIERLEFGYRAAGLRPSGGTRPPENPEESSFETSPPG